MSRSSSPARLFLGFGVALTTAALAAAVSLYGAQAPTGPTFGPVATYHVWDGHPAYWDVNLVPAFGAAGDFDGDGDLDVLITDGSQPTALRYMRNNGAGAFTPTRIEPSGPCPGPNCITNSNRVRAADVNNDGRMDAIIANNHSRNVSVLVNIGLNGAGIPIFTANNYLLFGAIGGGRAVNVGDLNNDGNLDLIAGNSDWNVYVFLGNGDGTFGAGTIYTDGGNNRLDIAVADLDNDGNNDVIVGNR
ncbi:MAG: VCBS repeat-containing protein, partial [Vicinamibacterales bacterium]